MQNQQYTINGNGNLDKNKYINFSSFIKYTQMVGPKTPVKINIKQINVYLE